MRARFLVAFVVIGVPAAAFAQAWTTGPRAAVYRLPATIGDGSNPQGGIPPAEAYEPADIGPAEIGQIYRTSDWIVTGSGHGDNGIHRLDGGEAKFRITCNVSHVGLFDPILLKGRAGAGHHHTFIGNKSVDQNSTYQTLRRNPASTCSGGPLNATAYWEPSLMKLRADGRAIVYKPNNASFYYTVQPYSETAKLYRLLNGLAFIGGVDPNNFNDSARRAEYAKAKGLRGGDALLYPGNGFGGWQCFSTRSGNIAALPDHAMRDDRGNPSMAAKYLKGPNGEDPWGGSCTAGTLLIANIFAPSCWDGHNLTSPNGRDHFRYPARSSHGTYQLVCPDGWWKVPHFEVKVEFGHQGFSDYGERFLSSDRMNPASAPADPKSLDPCRARGPWFCNGATMHFDWMNGWQRDIMDTWLKNCVGVTIRGVPGNPLTCGISTISATQRLKGGYSGEPSPDARFSNDPILVLDDLGKKPLEQQVFTAAPTHH